MSSRGVSRRTLLAGLIAFGLIVPSAALAAADEHAPAPTVVVLSWDGLRHDHPDAAELPALARIERDGVRAQRLTPVFPSNTFPGHVSLATGTYPDRHGIVDNHFRDREAGRYRMSADADWIQAEPLWIAAERQGVPAATYFWVGSESDWQGKGTRYREAPFDGDRPEAQKVDQILQWLALPDAQRPRLVMSYWGGVDSVGHRHGPDSPEVMAALAEQDAQLGRLLAGLDRQNAWAHTTLVLVSDHGMARSGAFLDLRGALEDAGVAAEVLGSATVQVFLDDPSDRARARAAAEALHPALRVYPGDALPAWMRLQHPTRTGDLVITVPPPYTLTRPPGLAGRLMSLMNGVGVSFGGHGYDPRLPEMGGVFMAMGRGVPADLTLTEVHQIDVAATVAALLGMQPPRDSEGHAIAGIGGSGDAVR